MTIEQKLISKLEPHAKRIKEGDGNDFDYLPAVLLQVMEEQKRQVKLLDDTAKLLVDLKGATETIGLQSKAQIAAFGVDVERRIAQSEVVIKDTQTQIQNSHSSLTEQIALLVRAHEVHVVQTKESLIAVGVQLESLASFSKQAYLKCMRLLIAGLVASTATIALVVAVLQRH